MVGRSGRSVNRTKLRLAYIFSGPIDRSVQLVPTSKPRPTFSAHSRLYSTSSFNRSAHLSVTSLFACLIQNFSRSHGTRDFLNCDVRNRRKVWKPSTLRLLSESRMILL